MDFVYQKALMRTFSHQLFDYKITFVNSQIKNIYPIGDFVLKNRVKISGIQNKSESKKYIISI